MSYDSDPKYTEVQAAKWLGDFKPQTLAAWRCAGRGPAFVKIGRAVRYRLSDLQAYLESRTVRNTAEAAQLESVA